MYLYFDKFGVLKETINDGAVRYGDDSSDTIHVYIEDKPALTSLAIVIQRPDESITLTKYMAFNMIPKEIPYDKNRDLKYFEDYKEYQFYEYKLTSEDLNQSGLYVATIKALNNNDIKAQGIITFNVENGVVKSSYGITDTQFDYLLRQIGVVRGAYLKSVEYNTQEYIFKFIDQDDNLYTYTLPFKDVYAKLEQLDQDMRYNNIGLLDVSDYDEDTGEITYIYNSSLIRKIDDSQLEETGIITIYARPLDWNEYSELRPSDEDRQIIKNFEKGGNL